MYCNKSIADKQAGQLFLVIVQLDPQIPFNVFIYL